MEVLDRIHESTKGMKDLEQWERYIEEYTEKSEQARKKQKRKKGSGDIHPSCSEGPGI